MVTKGKLLTLAEMQAIAQGATHEALREYRPPVNREHLTLGSEVTETQGVFELYLAGERPQDAHVISRATVDRSTGEVRVEVFLESLKR